MTENDGKFAFSIMCLSVGSATLGGFILGGIGGGLLAFGITLAIMMSGA